MGKIGWEEFGKEGGARLLVCRRRGEGGERLAGMDDGNGGGFVEGADVVRVEVAEEDAVGCGERLGWKFEGEKAAIDAGLEGGGCGERAAVAGIEKGGAVAGVVDERGERGQVDGGQAAATVDEPGALAAGAGFLEFDAHAHFSTVALGR